MVKTTSTKVSATPSQHESLPSIPVVDAGTGGAPAVLAAAPDQASRLRETATTFTSERVLRLGDRIARVWLGRSTSPYVTEIDRLAAAVPGPGVHALNLNYEWACTTAAAIDPDTGAARLMRVLDWDFDGLGRNLVAARHEGPTGPWIDLGWPGFAGAITIVAPGRFAAAINQPPPRTSRLPAPAHLVASRLVMLASTAMPAAHLLRFVAERARNFEDAQRMLADTPICLPVFFVLAGTSPDETALIERTERRAWIHNGPIAATNHWHTPERTADPPASPASHERQALLAGMMDTARDLDWLVPPIVNQRTRLACEAVPSTGAILAQAWESDGPATRPTRLDQPVPDQAAEFSPAGVSPRGRFRSRSSPRPRPRRSRPRSGRRAWLHRTTGAGA